MEHLLLTHCGSSVYHRGKGGSTIVLWELQRDHVPEVLPTLIMGQNSGIWVISPHSTIVHMDHLLFGMVFGPIMVPSYGSMW